MELIVKIGTLCITPLLILAATYIFRSKLIRWGAIAINTLFSVLLTLTVLNSPWGWSSQRDLNYKLYAEKEDGYQFVRSNFILLDNSFDKILVPFEDGDVDDSTATVMTNRYALARTMKLLNQHIENVDLVIVDIGFGSPSPGDSLLQEQVTALANHDKLLMATISNDSNASVIKAPGQVWANVKQFAPDRFYSSHSIYTSERKKSLPFRIYERLSGNKGSTPVFYNYFFRERINDKTRLSFNNFFPDFKFTDENRLLSIADTKQNDTLSHESEGNYEHYYYLSSVSNEVNETRFVENLENRKKSGGRNFVFIGSFKSNSEDIHPTSYGELHGPVILLNIVYSLVKGQHTLSLWLIFLLLAGYGLINTILVHRCLKIPILPKYVNDKLRRIEEKMSEKLSAIINKKRLLWKISLKGVQKVMDFLFVEQLHFLLLIGLIWLVRTLTGHMINGLALLLYYGLISMSLRFGYQKIIKP